MPVTADRVAGGLIDYFERLVNRRARLKDGAKGGKAAELAELAGYRHLAKNVGTFLQAL